jgi:hypothetical protein
MQIFELVEWRGDRAPSAPRVNCHSLRGKFMQIISLSAPPSYVLTRFSVIISSEDVNIGISLQVASGRLDTHLILTQTAG